MKLLNPTGGVIRKDGWGDGSFWARRTRDGVVYHHKGVDLTLLASGQPVVSPLDGRVKKFHKVYAGANYRGVTIIGKRLEVTMFYVLPSVKKGQMVKRGEIIGEAQDVSERYPPNDEKGEMLPHVHVEIRQLMNPWTLL